MKLDDLVNKIYDEAMYWREDSGQQKSFRQRTEAMKIFKINIKEEIMKCFNCKDQ